MPSPIALDIHEIGTEFTRNLADLKSVSGEIIWIGSGKLWRFAPGDAAPSAVIAEASDSPIVGIAGSGSAYLYVTRDIVRGEDPPDHWRLWFLSSAGATPQLVDEYDNEQLPSPTFTLNDRYLVWTAFHGIGDSAINVMRVADIDHLDQPRDLVRYPAHDTSLWLPMLNGDELWYGATRNDWSTGTVYPRVEMLNIGEPDPAPVVYGQDSRAFMPSANDSIVAWKGGGDPDLAALNAGQLYVYQRSTNVATPISIPDSISKRFSYPSVGTRFVSWWEDGPSTQFYIYDYLDHQVRIVAQYQPTGEERVLRPTLAGNLLAWDYVHDDASPQQIRWAVLPN